jgi:hypothetical protein
LDIGLFLVLVRRANTRFAPTLVSGIGWVSVFAQGNIFPLLVHTLCLNFLFDAKKSDIGQKKHTFLNDIQVNLKG